MSKTYPIHSSEDLTALHSKLVEYQITRRANGKKFKSLNITVKEYRKPKSSAQHRCYWRCVGELKRLLREHSGIVTNEEMLHEWIKKRSGFTNILEMPDGSTECVTRSIADKSDDATSENLRFLIEFIIQWAAENLGGSIEIGEEL